MDEKQRQNRNNFCNRSQRMRERGFATASVHNDSFRVFLYFQRFVQLQMGIASKLTIEKSNRIITSAHDQRQSNK